MQLDKKDFAKERAGELRTLRSGLLLPRELTTAESTELTLKKHDPVISKDEIRQILSFEPEDRQAVFVFIRTYRNFKWNGGIQAKLAAKQAFLTAFRVARELYETGAGKIEDLEKTDDKAKPGLLLPEGMRE